jgi:hypothetical protein
VDVWRWLPCARTSEVRPTLRGFEAMQPPTAAVAVAIETGDSKVPASVLTQALPTDL